MVINCDFYEKNKVVENVVTVAVKNIFLLGNVLKLFLFYFLKIIFDINTLKQFKNIKN
jgi:hypothetical protein